MTRHRHPQGLQPATRLPSGWLARFRVRGGVDGQFTDRDARLLRPWAPCLSFQCSRTRTVGWNGATAPTHGSAVPRDGCSRLHHAPCSQSTRSGSRRLHIPRSTVWAKQWDRAQRSTQTQWPCDARRILSLGADLSHSLRARLVRAQARRRHCLHRSHGQQESISMLPVIASLSVSGVGVGA